MQINVNQRSRITSMAPPVARAAASLLAVDAQLYSRAQQQLDVQLQLVPDLAQGLRELRSHCQRLAASCAAPHAEPALCWRLGASQTAYSKLLKAQAGLPCTPLRHRGSEVHVRPPADVAAALRACAVGAKRPTGATRQAVSPVSSLGSNGRTAAEAEQQDDGSGRRKRSTTTTARRRGRRAGGGKEEERIGSVRRE